MYIWKYTLIWRSYIINILPVSMQITNVRLPQKHDLGVVNPPLAKHMAKLHKLLGTWRR